MQSGFCLPAQIAHGAVSDLAGRGVYLAFLPQVTRLPHDNSCKDSFLCPITQGSPYFVSKAFPEMHFLSPVLDFSAGYAGSTAMTEMAVREMGIPRELADEAWIDAVRAQESH